ncbi:MAG: TetR/AcrR family transcriptional regulator [Oscillospiraceae bacterium]|nr:TetR/AcrR family transcriptional regulator [Oscillospiraceae bacterium]
MNPKFSRLPHEKQTKIFHAALEVFSRSGYKKAVTADIAAAAGISKGLLFFYFENKRGLYKWLFESCVGAFMKLLLQEDTWRGMDFFDAMLMGLKIKMDLARKHPALLGFVVYAWRERDPEVAACMRRFMRYMEDECVGLLLSWLDTSRFRKEIDPREILCLLINVSEGFLTQQYRQNGLCDMDALEKEFKKKLKLLRALAYQPEVS